MGSGCYRVRSIDPFIGNQVIVWLEDEQSGDPGPGDGTEWCVRVTMDEARGLLTELFNAYAVTMQNIAVELAAGGCRACGNTRRVGGDPCPTCMPRAQDRLRKAAHLRPREG